MKEIEITKNHLKLLKRMYVSWQDCEYGAPEINPKRPYGNSDVESDICEILEFKELTNGYETWYSEKDLDFAKEIHLQMEDVLQICLYFGEFKTGKFFQPNTWEKWQKVEIK